jgi:outer membrane receptor protein involved in Fe transport
MAGDPPLKQVVTRTLEAGLRGRVGGSTSWRAGVFRADNQDDLLFVAAPSANGYGYFRNFGKTRRQGLELGTRSKFGATELSLAWTWLDASYRSAETLAGAANSSNDGGPGLDGNIRIQPGDRIPLIPRQMLKAGLQFEPGTRWSLDLDAIAMAGSNARGNENGQHAADGSFYLGPGRSAGYAVANLGAAYKPAKGVKLYAQVKNLFDTRYNTAAQLGVAGFDAQGHFPPPSFPAGADGQTPRQYTTFYAPGAPRSLVLGVRYEFD